VAKKPPPATSLPWDIYVACPFQKKFGKLKVHWSIIGGPRGRWKLEPTVDI